ncbi:MAG: bifunctional helix-turn-helix transcriptional regulator/GNAT family N-acetyltransferase [Chlamydiales bacterium]
MQLSQKVESVRSSAKMVIRELGLLSDTYKKFDITVSESHLLQEIYQTPYLSVGDLAIILNLDKSTISRIVAKMVKKNYILQISDGSDRRKSLLCMTKQGYALVEEVNLIAHKQVEKALTLLTQEEQSIVKKGIELYAEALRQIRLKQEVVIEPLTKEDSPYITKIIIEVLADYDCNKPGYAFQDEELHCFYEAYQKPNTKYYIARIGERIVGGAGIAPLVGGDEKTCELKKMYLLKDGRGLGIGSILLNKCLETAKNFGFNYCYLETTDKMKHANAFYCKKGFQRRESPLGNTGHWACNQFYEKKL